MNIFELGGKEMIISNAFTTNKVNRRNRMNPNLK